MIDDLVSWDQPRDPPAYTGPPRKGSTPLLVGLTYSHLLLETFVGCALSSVIPTTLNRRKPCKVERLMSSQSQEHQANALKAMPERPAGLTQSQ